MSDPDSPEEFNPFKGIPIFGDLGKLFSQQASSTWETARQIAVAVATDGQSEPNVDPADRIALEELARVAELQVANATGLSTTRDGQAASIVPVTRAQWATATLDAYQDLLGPIGSVPSSAETEEASFDPAQAMFGQIMKMVGPVMLSMTAGSMVGNLAGRCLGQYDLPIPRDGSELMVVLANVDALADEWSLDPFDLRLWVCLSELTHHAVLSIPHVSQRLDELLADYVGSFEADPGALESRLSDLDLANPDSLSSLQSVLGDPEVILGAVPIAGPASLAPADHCIGDGDRRICRLDHGQHRTRSHRLIPAPQRSSKASAGYGRRSRSLHRKDVRPRAHPGPVRPRDSLRQRGGRACGN